MTNKNPKVFVSYSSKDFYQVLKLVDELETIGIKVWLDKWSIKVGDVINEKILNGIAECDFFVIIISKNSISSNWVKNELNFARQKEIEEGNTVILPLRFDESEIPNSLKTKRYANFIDFEEGMKELLHFFGIEDLKENMLNIIRSKEAKAYKKYQKILESMPDIFFVISKEGIYKDFVIKESDLYKIEDADIIGASIEDVGFKKELVEKIQNCIYTAIRYDSIETIEYEMDTPQGIFLFEMRIVKNDDESVISVSRDITKRKTAEFKLEKALLEAEERNEFTVKHTSIYATQISENSKRIKELIDEINKISTDIDIKKLLSGIAEHNGAILSQASNIKKFDIIDK